MRFITEFELHHEVINRTRSYRDYVSEKMNILEKRMGEQIAIAFHWNVPDKMEAGNYKLEIEAFPMDKWVEFKKKLTFYLQECEVKDELPETLEVIRMIKDLEFYINNKQAVDGLLNNEAPE